MARASKVGRNDPCECGSGKKFKNCCEGKAQKLSAAGWLIIGVIAAAAAIVLYFVVIAPPARAIPVGGRSCPPGQVWDPAHGHCH